MGNILSEVCNIESLCVLVTQSCLTPCDPMDCSPPALLSMESCKQEYWSGLPFPSPGDLPDAGIKPRSPALQTNLSEPPGKPIVTPEGGSTAKDSEPGIIPSLGL